MRYRDPLSHYSLQSRKYRRVLLRLALGRGAGNMNSGPYACVAGTLATDSSPQPQDLLFQEIKYDFNQTIFTS